MTQGVTAKRVAITLAVGSAFALFPILGTTTLLCFCAGVCLRLNQPIIHAVNLAAAFIYLPLIPAFVRLGDWLTGKPSSLDIPAMIALFWHHPVEFFHRFGTTALHGVLGWSSLFPFWVPLIYFGSLPLLRRFVPEAKRLN